MKGVRVCDQPVLRKGNVAHVLDDRVAGPGAVEVSRPGRGLDVALGEHSFFGIDASAEGE